MAERKLARGDVMYFEAGEEVMPDGTRLPVSAGWYRRHPEKPAVYVGPFSVVDALIRVAPTGGLKS